MDSTMDLIAPLSVCCSQESPEMGGILSFHRQETGEDKYLAQGLPQR